MIIVMLAVTSAIVTPQELPKAQTLVYPSVSAVEKACSSYEKSIDEDLAQFSYLSRKKYFTAAYQIWSSLLFRFRTLEIELWRTDKYSSDEQVKKALPINSDKVRQTLQMALSDRKILDVFLHNAKYKEQLTSQQRLFTANILRESEQILKKTEL